MAATRQDIESWFDRGVAEGATHMIVVCDTYDHDDYPVFVKPGEDPRAKHKEYLDGLHPMQRAMEVYSLKQDKALQMAEHRAFRFD